MVDLPAPDSPISPMISPRFSVTSTLSTRTAPVMVSTCSASSVRTSSSLIAPSHFRLAARGPRVDRQQPVDDEIDADGQRGDGDGGIERREQAELDRPGV